jgi:hypothetical protein
MAGVKGLLRGRLGKACVAIATGVEILRWLRIAAAVLSIGVVPQTSIAQTMSLPGSFVVNDIGAATYSVPIVVPPGTAGVVPSLTLSYSSQGSNGIVGMGWSLDGLPSVGRCPRTWTQDGVPGGINYDANDRFCFEGQRLVAIGGTYGADGTEYRTEVDGLSRILSHGTAGTGPAWFEVHTKSGQVMEFGHTADSQILAQGKTTARSWALNKLSDSKANYLTVTYVNDNANGQAYPSRIDYTGNTAANLSTYNSVQFVYATRPDISPAYQAGSLIQATVRLTDVKTYAGTSLTADYKRAYAQGIDSGRSHLSSITVCSDSGTTCLPATTLSWTDDSAGRFTTASNLMSPSAGWIPLLGDFNGDGKTDVLWCDAPSPSNTSFAGNSCTEAIFWLSKGDGTFATASNLMSPAAGWIPSLGDFNGDGKTDVMWCDAPAPSNTSFAGSSCTEAIYWLSKGDGTFAAESDLPSPAAGWIPSLGDFNGDGKIDVLWCDAPAASNTSFAGNSCTEAVFSLSNGPQQSAAISDLLVTIATGLGSTTSITYLPLTKSSVYTKDTNAVYPVQDLQGPVYVVTRVDTSNGVGGTYSSTYTYAGAKADLRGRGFLGFRQMQVTDPQTSIVKTSTYRQDFPYIAMLASAAKTQGSQTLNQTTNTLQFLNASGAATLSTPSVASAPYRVSISQNVSSSFDLDGSAIPSSTTSYQYDAYNNATQVSVVTSDGYSKTTNNTYTNDATNWLLGRLTASTVISQAPQQLGQYCALPWGGTIGNGQSVTAYSAASPAVGQACSAVAQTRTCTNGALSGSYSQQSCTPLACGLPWGGTIASGQSVTAYSGANPAVGQACSTIAQTRTCSLGALGGSYAQQSCAALCALPWGGTISQGQTVTAYSAISVPAPQACSSVAQTRTCGASGLLDGSFTIQSCVVRQPQRLYLTSGTTWTVPADWNNANNSVECIGAGGGGARAGGGGGGAYAKSTNIALTAGSSISVGVGVGGGGAGQGGHGGAGGDSWFNATSLSNAGSRGSALSCGAQGGTGSVDLAYYSTGGGVGGSTVVGSLTHTGGGGGSEYGIAGTPFDGGGGGGAAGPNGNGVTSGAYYLGVAGDAGYGGAGGGSYSAAGGHGTEFDASHGSGGGGAGAVGVRGAQPATSGAGGAYGGGGAGGAQNSGAGLDGYGGSGGNGLIVITYLPAS